MFEFAIAISRIISSAEFIQLPMVQQLSIKDIITNPSLVFINSVTSCKAWKLLLQEFKIKILYEQHIGRNAKSKSSSSKSKKEWSSGKKWIMGLLSAVLIGALAWVGKEATKNISLFSPEVLELSAPKDGSEIFPKNSKYKLEWNPVKGAKRYIVFVETYLSSEQKWANIPTDWRCVTKENFEMVTIEKPGKYRWKVSAIGYKDKTKSESKWYYFKAIIKETPNKANSADAKRRAAD